MPLVVIEFQETPNPHALKCILSGEGGEGGERGAGGAEGGLRSYRQPPPPTANHEGTPTDPVAIALFSIRGVTGLLIAPPPHNWVTVSKNPEVSWAVLKPALKAAFATLNSTAAPLPPSHVRTPPE